MGLTVGGGARGVRDSTSDSEYDMLRVLSTWTAPQGGPYYTTHNFLGTGDVNALDAHSAVSSLWGDFVAHISNLFTVTVQADVDEIDPATGQITQQHTVPPLTLGGSSSNEPLGLATMGLCRWGTGFYVNGRQIRGRTFVPGITTSAGDNGKPSPAAVAIFNPFLTAFIAEPEPGNEFVVWSRPKPSAPGFTTDVSAGSFWTDWAVLRSRRD